ncbi:MAG: MerR family transcriptional regulator [Nocardioides sp.]
MKIGEFARLGQVSVRMLRHYDQLGLLRPDRVAEWTGHRVYRPEQLATLNRVVALKELGLTLEQVGRVSDEQVNADELRGMLRLRQNQWETGLDRSRSRLDAICYRLRLIEGEDKVPNMECVMKSLPSMRIACLSTEVGSQPEIASAIGPMFDQLARALVRAGNNGWTPSATSREIDTKAPVAGDQSEWVTELQQPVTRSS